MEKNTIMIKILSKSNKDLDRLYEYICKIDADFTPRLSESIELKNWSEKLLNEGVVIAALNNGEIVGVSAIYCTPEKYDYSIWALWSALNDYRKLVGVELYRQTIEYCKRKGSKGLEGLCDISSKHILMLHQINGFKIIEHVKRKNGQKAAKIRLNFIHS